VAVLAGTLSLTAGDDGISAAVTDMAGPLPDVMAAPSRTSRTLPSAAESTTTWPSSVPERTYVPGAVMVTVEPSRVTSTAEAAS
jgi:hypothetical protein